VKEFLRELKEVTLMLYQPLNGEALQLTALQASSKTNPVQTRTISQGSKGLKLPQLL
jgi:hypothetical protein